MQSGHFKTYAQFQEIVDSALGEYGRPRLMGILFMRQGQAFADKEIIPHLKYFDARSGSDVHFVLPGWDHEDDVFKFSPVAFAEAVEAIEADSRWKYSGGIELILFAARSQRRESGGHELRRVSIHSVPDLSAIMVFDLNSLVGNKMFATIDQFFEAIFRFSRGCSGDYPVNDFAAQELRVSSVRAFVESLLGVLPEGLRNLARYVGDAGVRNISREHVPKIEVVSTSVETTRQY